MKTKNLWLIWLYLFAFCSVLGFIPDPPEFVKALQVTMGVCFFIPGGLLLKTKEEKIIRLIRLLSILSLVLTLICVVLNFVSVMMTPVWGTVLYILMGVVSTPMLCCQIWVISLFGWAILLAGSLFVKK